MFQSQVFEIRRKISLKAELSVVFLFLSIVTSVVGQPVPFIRTCQDPLVQAHLMKFTHTYCFHACGYLGGGTDYSSCTANGECLCNYPCDAAAPAAPFASDVCPPTSVNDPPDTDPTALPRCMAFCGGQCPGGQGSICGEVELLGPNMDMYAKICTCYCPPQPCTPPTTPKSFILKKPKPLLKLIKLKLLVWKAVLKKVLKLCLIIFKLSILFFIKLFLYSIYYFMFYEYIRLEAQMILRFARNIFGSIFDGSVFDLDFFDDFL